MLSAFFLFVLLFWTFAARMVCRLVGRIPVTSTHPLRKTSLSHTPATHPSTITTPRLAHALDPSLPCHCTGGQDTARLCLPHLPPPPLLPPPPPSNLTLTLTQSRISCTSLSKVPSQSCMAMRLTSTRNPPSPYPNLILLALLTAPLCQFLPPGSAAPVPETEEPGSLGK